MRRAAASSGVGVQLRGCAIFLIVFAILLAYPLSVVARLWYGETKGPFKNWMQVVDWEGDGDLDVLVSHTRWEDVSLSWAGIGLWVNQGDGTFRLRRASETDPWGFQGFAAAAGDVDRDGDIDLFTQDFRIALHTNQGGAQEGEPGEYRSIGGINAPSRYGEGYPDMGGTITLGDLNGDGWLDALMAGCCYGFDAGEPGDGFGLGPALSWVWINEQPVRNVQTGDILPLDFLDGRPIRQAALGDLDGDGDQDVFAAVGAPTLGTVASQADLFLLNDGAGSLTLHELPLEGSDSTSVALGDVDGDGLPDALVGTSAGADLWLNLGEATEGGGLHFELAEQSFAARRTVQGWLGRVVSTAAGKLAGIYLPLGSTRTTSVALADLDGDGDPDALLARLWAAEVWWNDGQGRFLRSKVRLPYREDTGIAVADFDGDGNPDVFAGRNEYDYQVWWNDGGGRLTPIRR